MQGHRAIHFKSNFQLQDANQAIADCDVRVLQTTAIVMVIMTGDGYGACLRSGGFIRSAHNPRLARRAST